MKMKPTDSMCLMKDTPDSANIRIFKQIWEYNAAIYAPFALPGERTAGDKIVPQVGSQRLRGG